MIEIQWDNFARQRAKSRSIPRPVKQMNKLKHVCLFQPGKTNMQRHLQNCETKYNLIAIDISILKDLHVAPSSMMDEWLKYLHRHYDGYTQINKIKLNYKPFWNFSKKVHSDPGIE